MLAQAFAALVGDIALALLVVFGASRIAARSGAIGPRLIDNLDLDGLVGVDDGSLIEGREGRGELHLLLRLLLLEHDVGL